jgi:hypothetical protein
VRCYYVLGVLGVLGDGKCADAGSLTQKLYTNIIGTILESPNDFKFLIQFLPIFL